MLSDWNLISSDVRPPLTRSALERASTVIAIEAELLADDIERGLIDDHGGADALRFFAALVRLHGEEQGVACTFGRRHTSALRPLPDP